jgi:ABC-type multidrug transport system ATPase subunit
MIEIKGLTVAYGERTVLDRVDLTIGKQERCALVGNNGAGKSTLIHAMLGLLPVRHGIAAFNGISHRDKGWKKHVSYLPEKFQMYPHLTGEENLRFFASLDGSPVDMARIGEILRKVRLWDARGRQLRGYSKGMLQRLGLALMLYFDSEILILDEPTSGLDPDGRAVILSILHSLADKTILFSSHHMEEIKSICTHVAVLTNAQIQKYTVQQYFQTNPSGGVVI